ncbi:MAG: hypothetical protein JXB48_21265, partial [Candidatus Latescibacteria bacterium]|nr:hypothetical protein [Candidatus Latescibacterota bacterium]
MIITNVSELNTLYDKIDRNMFWDILDQIVLQLNNEGVNCSSIDDYHKWDKLRYESRKFIDKYYEEHPCCNMADDLAVSEATKKESKKLDEYTFYAMIGFLLTKRYSDEDRKCRQRDILCTALHRGYKIII